MNAPATIGQDRLPDHQQGGGVNIPASYRRRGFVYAIRDNGSSAVKIGFSINPLRRLKQLQTGHASVLRLICIFENVQAFELSLHQSFADRRMAGEWFDDRDCRVSTLLLMASGVAA